MHRRQLNFIQPSTRSLRLLQAATLTAFSGLLVIGYSLVPALTGTRATISDTIASNSLEPSPSATPHITPRIATVNATTATVRDQSSDGIRYFEKATGRAFRIDLAANKESIISDDKIAGFRGALWSSNSTRAVITTTTPSGPVLLSRDVASSTEVKLNSSFTNPALSPSGTSIAFVHQTNDGASAIIITDSTGANERQLIKTRADSISLYWKDDEHLSFVSQRSDRAGADLSLIAPDGSLRTIVSNKENLELTWSPRGDLLLYSFFDAAQGVSLWLWSDAAHSSIPLSLATSASKCAWDPQEEFIICGIPTTTSLTRDIPAQQTATNDAIEKLDFTTLTHEQLYASTPGKLLGVTRPLITSSGNYFVFTNMFDEKLMSLPIGH